MCFTIQLRGEIGHQQDTVVDHAHEGIMKTKTLLCKKVWFPGINENDRKASTDKVL